ncbi:MAG: hypothetical protein EBU88_11885, partial [Acidobacteria bacterium]|nr:hypothetical protein [Acidobacteriota bacterium]
NGQDAGQSHLPATNLYRDVDSAICERSQIGGPSQTIVQLSWDGAFGWVWVQWLRLPINIMYDVIKNHSGDTGKE